MNASGGLPVTEEGGAVASPEFEQLVEVMARAISAHLRGVEHVWDEDRRTARVALSALLAARQPCTTCGGTGQVVDRRINGWWEEYPTPTMPCPDCAADVHGDEGEQP